MGTRLLGRRSDTDEGMSELEWLIRECLNMLTWDSLQGWHPTCIDGTWSDCEPMNFKHMFATDTVETFASKTAQPRDAFLDAVAAEQAADVTLHEG